MSEVIEAVDNEPKTDLIIDSTTTLDNSTDPNLDNISDINIEIFTKLDEYESYLNKFKEADPPNHEIALQLLLARDALQIVLEKKEKKSVDLLLRLPELDAQLKLQEEAIAEALHLSVWRDILHPSTNNWWWFFEAKLVPKKVSAWDRLDWFWNLSTLLCLTGFVSFSSKIIPLIFSNGLSVFESIGLLGPGGMLALVLSSMQGGKGQKKLQELMGALGIPARFQSEATFLISFILFLGGHFAQENLPQYYFKSYFNAGQKAYKDGQILEARESYEQALKIDGQPSNEVAQIYTAIGLLNESLGNDNDAVKDYLKALDAGDTRALNNLGRVSIYKGKLDEAETFLNMGIHRANPDDIPTQYQLYRNLGWVYLEKKRYAKSEEYLTKAIDFDRQIAKGELGKGMANCFKARLYELQEKPDKAANQWGLCLEFGKPETFHEYETIVKINPEIGSKLDSKGIFK